MYSVISLSLKPYTDIFFFVHMINLMRDKFVKNKCDNKLDTAGLCNPVVPKYIIT